LLLKRKPATLITAGVVTAEATTSQRNALMLCVIEFCTNLPRSISEARRGQTMTEYALILAAIAIVVYVAYNTLGNDIGTLVNHVDSILTTAAS
jgi:Flp pilus assembly pilin Flp